VQEFNLYKKSGSDLFQIRSLKYEHEHDIKEVGEKDSGLYILMIVEKYAMSNENEEKLVEKSFLSNSVEDLKGSFLKRILDYGKN
jgi:hypothetical protein